MYNASVAPVPSCSSIQNLRNRRKNNGKFIEKLSTQNAELQKRKEADKAKFLEIRSDISKDDIGAVQEDRYNLREEYMTELSQQIRHKYNNDYDYTILKDVEQVVNCELHEKPLSIKRKLQRSRQHPTKQNRRIKHRNQEKER